MITGYYQLVETGEFIWTLCYNSKFPCQGILWRPYIRKTIAEVLCSHINGILSLDLFNRRYNSYYLKDKDTFNGLMSIYDLKCLDNYNA